MKKPDQARLLRHLGWSRYPVFAGYNSLHYSDTSLGFPWRYTFGLPAPSSGTLHAIDMPVLAFVKMREEVQLQKAL